MSADREAWIAALAKEIKDCFVGPFEAGETIDELMIRCAQKSAKWAAELVLQSQCSHCQGEPEWNEALQVLVDRD